MPQLLGLRQKACFFNFELLTFHFNECPQFYSAAGKQHKHDVFHIVFYTEENLTNKFLLNAEKITSRPGLLVLLPPGVPHSFSPLKNTGNYTYHELTFRLIDISGKHVFRENFAALFSQYWGTAFKEVPFTVQLNKPGMILAEHHYSQITESLMGMKNNELGQVYAKIADFIFFVIEKSCAVNSTLNDDKVSPFILKAREYLEKNYKSNPSLHEIAVAAGISPEHLCRKFRECYGVAPVHYGLKLRISAAEQLLATSNLSIGEISSRLGFCDVYTFSKAFKRELKTAPAVFRKKGFSGR